MNIPQGRDLLEVIVAIAIILLISFPVHEFSHALAAFRLGDSTARYMGRLSLDPRRHFDPMGGAMLAISALSGFGGIGWAKPTPVNPINLEGGRRGESIVAAAGPVSNLLLAALASIPLRIVLASPAILSGIGGNDVAIFALGVLDRFVFINAALFVFNLLPIPPLDGWKVVLGFVNARTAYTLRQYEPYGFVVILLIVFAGGGPLIRLISGVHSFLVGL